MEPIPKSPRSSPSSDANQQFPGITFETPDTVRKQGQVFRLRREVEAMNYVRSHTSIPVPRVLDTQFGADGIGEDNERGFILMNRLPGSQFGEVWKTMGDEAREQTLRQLKSYLEELHAIEPPAPGWIGSCSGGPAYDHRIDNLSTCGPFGSVGEFHDFLVAPIKKYPRPEVADKYRKLLLDSHGIRFAHADISWENILVDPTSGTVTGILDWEMAGFWPIWWEFRKSLYGARSKTWWIDVIKEIMPEYGSETDADMDLEMF